MPAAGDSNPTWFIAKFQRNTPLPPLLLPCLFDGRSLKPIRSVGHKCAPVKDWLVNPEDLPARYDAPQGHLHVPGEPAAPVELPEEDTAHSGLHCRVHGPVKSIAGAIPFRVNTHLWSGLTLMSRDLFKRGEAEMRSARRGKARKAHGPRLMRDFTQEKAAAWLPGKRLRGPLYSHAFLHAQSSIFLKKAFS